MSAIECCHPERHSYCPFVLSGCRMFSCFSNFLILRGNLARWCGREDSTGDRQRCCKHWTSGQATGLLCTRLLYSFALGPERNSLDATSESQGLTGSIWPVRATRVAVRCSGLASGLPTTP